MLVRRFSAALISNSRIFYRSPDPGDVGSGADRTNWFRLHFCTACRVAALLNFNSFQPNEWKFETRS